MTKSDKLAATTPRRQYPGISPRAFQHPLDMTALDTLHRVRGMDWIVRKFLMAIGERRLRLLFLASAVRVSDDQLPRIKKIYDEACATLDIEDSTSYSTVVVIGIGSAPSPPKNNSVAAAVTGPGIDVENSTSLPNAPSASNSMAYTGVE